MDILIRQVVDDHGVAPLQRASGLPFSTVWRWVNDGIPGDSDTPTYQMRHDLLLAAAKKVLAEAKKARAA